MLGKVTKKHYVEFLVHTPVNYTSSNLASHLENVSHDAVSDFLAREKATSSQIWELAEKIIDNKDDSFLIVDDSVQDKNYSQKTELVRPQYSGTTHSVVRGIGVINLVHYQKDSGFNPIDYRLYSPDQDGKTKNEHAREMITKAKSEKNIKAKTVLMDSYYASVDNLKLINRLGLFFVTQLKSNRCISLSKEGGYIHLTDIEWTSERLQFGLSVKLKELPFRVQLFKVAAPNGDIDWVVTNHPEKTSSDVIQEENTVRWKIEEMHRELKQLTGTEKCQSRKLRSQRNHISYCYQAWFALKKKARETGETAYAIRNGLYSEFLKTVLKNPVIPAYHLCT